MRKDDYKQAIDEIHASNKLKNETVSYITKKKNSKGWAYGISTVMIAAVIAVSIIVPMRNNKLQEENDPLKIIASTGELPKVENFDNLKKLMEENQNLRGGHYYEDGLMVDAEMTNADVKTAGAVNESATERSSNDHSETNVQVEGVDEADIVKTDGEYIYYISDDKIVIVNAKDPQNLKIESQIEFEDFYPCEMYINGNKLIAIGYEYAYGESYSYDRFTTAKQYDITNKAKAKLTREVKVEGYYISSRMIDDNVYIISNRNLNYLRYRRGRAYIEEDETNDIPEDDYKPKFVDTAESEGVKCLEFTDVCYIPDFEECSYLNIASFNLNNDNKANIQSILGGGQTIYASEKNIYVALTKYEYKDTKSYGYYDNYDLNTYIYKFEINGADVKYKAAGKVPGSILNQFSMDENDGYFRIATTDYTRNKSDNNLYVLDENMEMVGKLENLAKGERIYSVRFMQNRAYMVTFVQTDPLFVIDLKDPKNPTVLGELKIPGYSKYLHPYDENHLIGFGEETKVNKYGGVVTDGIKMALFDVTDPTNPKEMFKTNIGDSGTYSELLYNHKALLFSKEKNLMAFPITISQDTGDYRTNLRFQGAMVYNVDLENGFTLKGLITHKEAKEDDEEEYFDYDFTKEVERIIYIGNNLFTLSESLIKAVDLNEMKVIGNLEIKAGEKKVYPLINDVVY